MSTRNLQYFIQHQCDVLTQNVSKINREVFREHDVLVAACECQVILDRNMTNFQGLLERKALKKNANKTP